MYLHKLRFFTVVVMTIAIAPAERIGVQARELDQPTPRQSCPGNEFPMKGEIWPPVFLPVQSKNPSDLGTGKLLVASQGLADPNFAQTVVLLVHYGADGAVGLVLNRRTDVPLSRVFQGLKAAKERSDRVYLGGPVERPTVFALLQSKAKPDGAEHVFGGTYLIASKPVFEQTISTRPDPGAFHVYLGYAGWAKAQLQMEVTLGAWFIFQADAQTIFSSDPDSLWQQMIRKTELKLAQSGSAHAEAMPADKFKQVLYQGMPSGVPPALYSPLRLQALARGGILFPQPLLATGVARPVRTRSAPN